MRVAFLLLLFASMSFGVQAGPLALFSQPSNLRPYLGQVSGRSFFNDQTQSLTGNVMERAYSYARTNMVSPQLVFTNFYVDTNDIEQNAGNTYTLKASIEYPLGTCTALTFSASSSAIVANGGFVISDAATGLSIPNGATWYWRAYISVSGNFLSRGFDQATAALKDTANGDAINTSGTDQTTSCTAVSDSGSSQAMLWPSLMLAVTTQPSVLLIGDSREIGYTDSYSDGAGYIGNVERSIAPYFAESNMARSSNTACQFVANETKRSAFFQYFSSVVDEFGINDLYPGIGNETAAQLLTCDQEIWALFGTKPVYRTTLEPEPSSTNSCATTGSQTAATWDSQRTIFNSDVKAIPPGVTATFDVTSIIETGSNTGLWKAPGYTGDCIHELQAGAIDIVTAGIIPSSAIHR